MSNPYTVYDLQTGQVLRSGAAPGDIAMQASSGEGVLPIEVAPDEWYFDFDSQSLQLVRSMDLLVSSHTITADGSDAVTITNVPPGARVVWHDGQIDDVLDNEVQMKTDLPGTYRLRIIAITYQAQEVTIEAVSAT